MKKAVITISLILLAIISSFAFKDKEFGAVDKSNIPYGLQLKVDRQDDILYAEEKDDIECDAPGQCINKGKIVKYTFAKNKVLKAKRNGLEEDINKRTPNSEFYPVDDKSGYVVVYSGDNYYEKEDGWYLIENATTTVDAFNKQVDSNKISWLGARDAIAQATNGFNTSHGDGYVWNQSNDTWTNVHGASAGTSVSDDAPNTYAAGVLCSPANACQIFRNFLVFKTSDIGAGYTVASGTLHITEGNSIIGGSTDKDYIVVVETFQNSDVQIVVGDFEDCGSDNGTAGRASTTPIEEGSDQIDYNDIATADEGTFTLNSTGLGWIDTTGTTTIGFRMGLDVENVSPPLDNTWYLLAIRYSEETGTTSDPYLLLYVESAESAPTVTTQAPTSVSYNSMTANGTITADNGASSTVRGFVYDTSSQSDPGSSATSSSGYASSTAEYGTYGEEANPRGGR